MTFLKILVLLTVLLFSLTACQQKYHEEVNPQKQEFSSKKHFYDEGNGQELIQHRKEIQGVDH